MRAGTRELFWHLPLVARRDASGALSVLADAPPLGYVTAEPVEPSSSVPRITLAPVLLDRVGFQIGALPGPTGSGPSWSSQIAVMLFE